MFDASACFVGIFAGLYTLYVMETENGTYLLRKFRNDIPHVHVLFVC